MERKILTNICKFWFIFFCLLNLIIDDQPLILLARFHLSEIYPVKTFGLDLNETQFSAFTQTQH